MKIIGCEHCTTRQKSVVADLTLDQLRAFRSSSVIGLYRRRQVIFHEGAPANGLYVVCRGVVKLYQSDRFGRDHILGLCEPGDVLGELPIDASEPYSVTAEALTDTQLCFLPRTRLVDFLELHPQVGIRLIAALSKALSVARRKVRSLALKPAESRLAELLLQLAGADNGEPHPQPVVGYSRREIAAMIGVSPETAIRLLAQLKRKHAIDLHKREVVITDAEKLARLANRDSINTPS